MICWSRSSTSLSCRTVHCPGLNSSCRSRWLNGSKTMLFLPSRSSIFQCSAATVELPLSSPLSSFFCRPTWLTLAFSSSGVQGCAFFSSLSASNASAEEVVLLLGHPRQQVAQVAEGERREAHLHLIVQKDARLRLIAWCRAARRVLSASLGELWMLGSLLQRAVLAVRIDDERRRRGCMGASAPR